MTDVNHQLQKRADEQEEQIAVQEKKWEKQLEKGEASLQTQTTRAGTNSAGTANGRKEKRTRAQGEEQQEDNSQLQETLSLEQLHKQVQLLQDNFD